MSWRPDERIFEHNFQVLYAPPASSQPSTPPRGGARASRRASAAVAQDTCLARARQTYVRQGHNPSEESPLFYFELFVKTTGGGLQPTGNIAVGLAELPPDAADADGSDALQGEEVEVGFLSYHSNGKKYATSPRATLRAGKPCGPSFGVGDTVGCGWLPSGEVFFTFNGRHLGVAFSDVWGALCPAVDFDSPGACLELTTGSTGQRPLKYQRGGVASSLLARSPGAQWLSRVLPAKLADAAAERVDKMADKVAAQAGELRGSFSATAAASVLVSSLQPAAARQAEPQPPPQRSNGAGAGGDEASRVCTPPSGPQHSVMERAQSEPAEPRSAVLAVTERASPNEAVTPAAKPSPTSKGAPASQLNKASSESAITPPVAMGRTPPPSLTPMRSSSARLRAAHGGGYEIAPSPCASLPSNGSTTPASRLLVRASPPTGGVDAESTAQTVELLESLLFRSAGTLAMQLSGRWDSRRSQSSSQSSSHDEGVALRLRNKAVSASADLSDAAREHMRWLGGSDPPLVRPASLSVESDGIILGVVGEGEATPSPTAAPGHGGGEAADSATGWPEHAPVVMREPAGSGSSTTSLKAPSERQLSWARGLLPSVPLLRLTSAETSRILRVEDLDSEELELAHQVGVQCAQIRTRLSETIEAWLQPTDEATDAPIQSLAHPQLTLTGRGVSEHVVGSVDDGSTDAAETGSVDSDEWVETLPRSMSSFKREESEVDRTRGVEHAEAAAGDGHQPLQRASSIDDFSSLRAALDAADEKRALEESQRTELDRLIAVYETCQRCCARHEQREQLKGLAKMYRDRGALKDTAESREGVTEVVVMLASPPREMQLCAAALSARLADSVEGAKQLLACGGLGPLMALWEQSTILHPEPTSSSALAVADGSSIADGGSLEAEHRRHAAMYACQALAQLVMHAPNTSWREQLLRDGAISPLLAIATRERMHRASDAPSRERLSSSDSTSGVVAGDGGAHTSHHVQQVFEAAWRDELQLLASKALLDLARRDGARADLISEGALFKWMELAADHDVLISRLAVQALRCVSESEGLRARMLAEAGLLQALVNLTNSDDADITRNAVLAVLQLATDSSHSATFLQLLPAMPLASLCRDGSVELQHACARLFYLLGRTQSGGAQIMQLSEAAAVPLVALCTTATQSQVQCATAQAVARLAQQSEHARKHLMDAGILPPLTQLLTSADAQAQHCAAVAVRQLSSSSMRGALIAQAEPMLALISCVVNLAHNPAAAHAALWALSNACAVPSSLAVFVEHLDASHALLDALRLHIAPLTEAHLPAAMILQHMSTIASHGHAARIDEEADDEAAVEGAERASAPAHLPPSPAVDAPAPAGASPPSNSLAASEVAVFARDDGTGAVHLLKAVISALAELLAVSARRLTGTAPTPIATPTPTGAPSPASGSVGGGLLDRLSQSSELLSDRFSEQSTPSSSRRSEEAAAPAALPPAAATPTTPASVSASSTAADVEHAARICAPLCRSAWLIASSMPNADLREALVRGCVSSLFTLSEHGDDAFARQAWRVLVRLGFPEATHELRELAADSPSMLSEWWLLNEVLRRTSALTAPPPALAPPMTALASPATPTTPPSALPLSVPTEQVCFKGRHFGDFQYTAALRRLVADHLTLTALRFESCSFSEKFCARLPSVLAGFEQFSALFFHGTAGGDGTSWNGRSPSFGGGVFSSGGASSSAQEEPLAFLPIDLPPSVTALHLEAGAVSRNGVRVLGAALHSAISLRVLSLAYGGLRGSDMTPIFSLLQGGPATPPCGLLQLLLHHNRLADAGAHQLVDALCAGGKAGSCQLHTLDLASNQLTSGSVEDLCRLVGSLASLENLDVRDNAFVVSQAGNSIVNGVRGSLQRGDGGAAIDALRSAGQALPSLLNIPAALRAGGKAKDLLIAVLINTTICELQLDPGFFSAAQAAQLHQKLTKNREQRTALRDHNELGADAPPLTPSDGGRRLSKRVLSWGRGQRQPQASGEVPVLGVLFSAPLVCTDPSGQVVPMDMLDFEKERALICDSMREARRNLRVRFEHATTDRLRTLVTLGQCVGLHYSGHGDPNVLSMEDGRGNAHFVRVPALKKLLQAGNLASLRFVFVSACFSEAAAQAFVDAGVPHVVAVRVNTRVSDHAAHAFTRAFYLSLAVGQTIREAFDIGVQAVINAPNVPAGEVEGDKFLLLGPGAHDEKAFPALAPVEAWQPPVPPAAQLQQPLPAKAEAFLGRNVETYRVITGVLDRRLVTVTGPPGVGKSAVAIAAINYLAERHYYSDGVVYIECAAAREIDGLCTFLRTQLCHLAPNAPAAEARVTGLAALRAAIAPLQGLHCLLVLDGVRADLTEEPLFTEFLSLLLSFGRVRTLLTAVSPVAQPLQGGAEKVVDIQPLSRLNTARLLCRLSPRPLLLKEIEGAGSAADFVQRLAQHEFIINFNGNPGFVKATAPRLSVLSLPELHKEQLLFAPSRTPPRFSPKLSPRASPLPGAPGHGTLADRYDLD